MSLFKKIFIVLLLFSILMRVIWVNLRDYEPELTPAGWSTMFYLQESAGCDYQPKLQELTQKVERPAEKLFSSGLFLLGKESCKRSKIEADKLREWNQWAVVATAWFLVLTARILSRSWLFSVVTGTVVLSRGAFIGRAGVLGTDSILALLLAICVFCIAHFFRSGSRKVLVLFGAVSIVGALFDLTFLLIQLGFGFFVFASACYHKIIFPKLNSILHPRASNSTIERSLVPEICPKNEDVTRPLVTSLVHWLDSFYAFTLGESSTEVRTNMESRGQKVFNTEKFLGGSLFVPRQVKYSRIFETKSWVEILVWTFAFGMMGWLLSAWLQFTFLGDDEFFQTLKYLVSISQYGVSVENLGVSKDSPSLLFEFWDIHLIASLIMIGLVIVQPKHTIMEANRPFNVFLLLFILLVSSFAIFRDPSNLAVLKVSISGQPVSSGELSSIAWIEPTVLALGVVSLRVLMRSIRERLLQ